MQICTIRVWPYEKHTEDRIEISFELLMTNSELRELPREMQSELKNLVHAESLRASNATGSGDDECYLF